MLREGTYKTEITDMDEPFKKSPSLTVWISVYVIKGGGIYRKTNRRLVKCIVNPPPDAARPEYVAKLFSWEERIIKL